MSEAITTTTVLLAGSRDAIIEILNRAFRVCSGGYKIADDESIETINGKINAANELMAGYRTAFTLMGYLDHQSRMYSLFKDFVLSYIDEENPTAPKTTMPTRLKYRPMVTSAPSG